MKRHFDMKCYPRERRNKFLHNLWGAIIQGSDYSRGATNPGNTVNVEHRERKRIYSLV